jgi:ubiquitin-like-conjugating enzyme ATG3
LEREAANANEQLISSEGDGDDAWVATHTDRPPRPDIASAAGIPDIEMDDADDEIRDMDIDDIPGLEDMQMPSDDESDDETSRRLYCLNRVFADSSDITVRTRTYDLYITYDKYWRCPRLWLFGYTALGAPLPIQAIMEDISTDYVDKTVTMETWQHMEGQSMSMASVHPCKHSHVMQTIIARQSERGDEVRVDQYHPFNDVC